MAGGEYLTSNALIDFPFKQDQGVPERLSRLFVDACVYSSTYDVAVSKAEYSSGVLSFSAGGLVYSFDPVGSGESGFAVIRNGMSAFVIDSDYLRSLDSFSIDGEFVLEPSCIFVDAEGVTSIEIFNGTDGTDNPDAILTGDVLLNSGYNTTLSEDEDGQSITITASPGSGLGVVPCESDCSAVDFETDGRPLVTDDGHAVIAGDGCYEISQNEDTVQIHGKCVACCQCDMYVNIVEELRRIAYRVKKEKDDTEKRTSTYYNMLGKFTVDGGKPTIDMQIDISPDARISEMSYRKSKKYNTGSINYFCVTCTITNTSGVPCAITVPDLWNSGEYGNSGILSIRGSGPGNKELSGNEHLLLNGIQATVGGPAFGGLASGLTIDPQGSVDNPGGWVVYSSVKGPLIKKRDDDNREYLSIGLRSRPGWLDKIKSGDAYSTMAQMALKDLNNGVNPSGIFEYGEAITNSIDRLDDIGGFVMPAGYSFVITNTYALSTGSVNNSSSISAMFRGYIYAPLLMYTSVYNLAIPTVHVNKHADGTITYSRTWSMDGAMYGENIIKSSVSKPVWGGAWYNYETGELKSYYVKNGAVNVGNKNDR